MTKEQLRVYDTLMDRAPAWVAAKVKRGLPPSKQEASQLNAFLTASRQATNTTAPFQQDQKNIQDPKIQAAFSSLKKTLEGNPRARAVVYSNFLDAGINPYKAKLDEAKIPYGEFTGAMSKKKREEIVQQYNAGKLRTLLLSSAGGEGLDLKGTRLMQILEPHWNEEKLKQVHGRGARYMSHSDLPPEERKLLIENYIAKRPQGLPTSVYNKITGRAPDKSVDEYLTQMSGDKEKLIEQFRALLPNGKEKKSAAEKKKELFVTDENTQRGKTTEVSRELAKSLKPRAAAFATFTAPLALTGFRLARGLGPNMSTKSQALAGGVGAALGGALGHFIAHNQTANIINDSKAIARQALRTASKENSLREEAGKMNWGDVARSSRNRVISDVATSAPVLTRLATQHIQGKGLKFPTTDLGLMAAGNILGSIGSGYLEKYKKMIAVNELDNVKARMAEQDATRLKRLRNQVAQLETRVEGDGWNAPKKDDAPVEKKKGKLDW
jgi:superfamily II DNA/RNA helicase